ncbi:HAD family hydrolase [Halobacteriales archaeon QS_1_68_20]|nr:MAG: HAD family hydrolase [Halobacteriales archaeon QS_1_68_20]
MTGFDAALIDLDGTVVHGGSLLAGAGAGVEALREAGLEVLFLTNNPTRSPAGWADHLSELGLPGDADEVLTSAEATVRYLDAHHAGARALPVAGPAVVEQLETADVTFVEDPTAAEVVVAGYHAGFDDEEMTRGLRALLDGATLVGTNRDRWVPTDAGPIPGSGAVINAVAGAAEVDPEAVLGKPSQETVDLAMDRVGAAPGDCLLVGDRLDTDIAMGERAGATTALVLTGAATGSDLEQTDVRPDYVLESLAEVERVLDGDAVDGA